jgi:hypothetical protein
MEDRLLDWYTTEGRTRLGMVGAAMEAARKEGAPCPPTRFLASLIEQWDMSGYQLANILAAYQPPHQLLQTIFTFEPTLLKVQIRFLII